jgi:hypothetical protein
MTVLTKNEVLLDLILFMAAKTSLSQSCIRTRILQTALFAIKADVIKSNNKIGPGIQNFFFQTV